jgi:hypothetical protein
MPNDEMDEEKERMKILLRAMCDMMKKLEESRYVLSIFEQTAVWDGVECDGGCLFEEAKALIEYDA